MTNQSRQESCFSVRLKDATRRVHGMAEQTRFVKGFLKGTASCSSYLQLLTDLYPVYTTMEAELDRLHGQGAPFLENFYFPELYRSEALAKDIAFLEDLVVGGENYRASQASIHYANRVSAVARSAPVLLVGHLYTRYLGDLSGGQILSRIAQRSMGLSVGRGLDFYEFEEISSCAEMKQRFRRALDTLDPAEEQVQQAVCDEANRAFRLNISIFENLEGSALLSLFRNLPVVGVRAEAIRSEAMEADKPWRK